MYNMYFSLPRDFTSPGGVPRWHVQSWSNGLGDWMWAVQFVLLSPHIFLQYRIKKVGQYCTTTSICVFINNCAAKRIHRSFGFMIEGGRI